jgi:O-acetylserine/cysteine efflux transporter
MPLRHVALAVLVAAVWGCNFVAIRWGLDAYPPLLLIALRFAISAAPVLFVPRPQIPWPRFLTLALFMFVLQFAFLFAGMELGMTPGMASILMQSQAFLTPAFAMIALGEKATARQIAGGAVALAGLALVATTVDASMTVVGFLLTLAAAASWAVGNVMQKSIGPVDRFALTLWLSLVPPIPALIASIALEGDVVGAVMNTGWRDVGALLYLAVVSTWFGYVCWGRLLSLYPMAAVSPYALLIPIFGMASSALVFGERFGPERLGGAALVMLGVAIATLSFRRRS